METTNRVNLTLGRAQNELDELLADLKAGTLDRIRLEAGLVEVRARLEAITSHEFSPGKEPARDPKPSDPKPPAPKPTPAPPPARK